jgi:hypothetical protein
MSFFIIKFVKKVMHPIIHAKSSAKKFNVTVFDEKNQKITIKKSGYEH